MWKVFENADIVLTLISFHMDESLKQTKKKLYLKYFGKLSYFALHNCIYSEVLVILGNLFWDKRRKKSL